MNTLSLTDDTFGSLWKQLLKTLRDKPASVAPRGYNTREQLNVQLHLTNPYANVLVNDARNISYRFMVAEWLWIYFGHDDVKTISQYNSNIAQFSDNGIDFNGAYGKAIAPHWKRIITTLKEDRDSRQAVIAIYRAPHRPTKDVPCTISLQWVIRQNGLHCIATMRSSDIWLGLPYDVFTFTMLSHILSNKLKVPFKSFTINLGSSHLYERDIPKTSAAITSPTSTRVIKYFKDATLPLLLEHALMNSHPDVNELFSLQAPWNHFKHLLHAPSNKAAYKILHDELTTANS
jgi:thymidylate synthase